jgi:hypothetical protein
MFFKTAQANTKNIRALAVFKYSACFASLGCRLVFQISASFLKSDLTMKITIPCEGFHVMEGLGNQHFTIVGINRPFCLKFKCRLKAKLNVI